MHAQHSVDAATKCEKPGECGMVITLEQIVHNKCEQIVTDACSIIRRHRQYILHMCCYEVRYHTQTIQSL